MYIFCDIRPTMSVALPLDSLLYKVSAPLQVRHLPQAAQDVRVGRRPVRRHAAALPAGDRPEQAADRGQLGQDAARAAGPGRHRLQAERLRTRHPPLLVSCSATAK